MSEQKDDPWFIVRAAVVVVLLFGGAILAVTTIVSDNRKAASFKADVKERCTAVYKTLEHGNVTSIYRCPDDTRYEFTELL